MQKKLSKGPLLDKKGHLKEAGFAYELVKAYNRPQIHASALRIKEWDYLYIQTYHYGIGIVIADNGYMGLLSVTVMDFKAHTVHSKQKTVFMSKGDFNMPCSTETGEITIAKKSIGMHIKYDKQVKTIKVYWPHFTNGHEFKCDITLDKLPHDSMVMAVPFDSKPTHFYYNQKILGMRAKGTLTLHEKTYTLADDALAMIDFGRGVWPYKSNWYWGAAQGYQNNRLLALNIGHGFGNQKNASEDMFFVDGKAHKLDRGTFNIPKNQRGKLEYMKEWEYQTEDQRLKVIFKPVLLRKDNTNLLVLKSCQNQVFGHYTGSVTLDGGEILHFKHLPGFAEVFKNRW